jgi:hypothetical protein
VVEEVVEEEVEVEVEVEVGVVMVLVACCSTGGGCVAVGGWDDAPELA